MTQARTVVTLQVRRGTNTEWNSVDPTLAAGELGFNTSNGKFKIGTGNTVWSLLDYAAVTPGDLEELAQDALQNAFFNGTHVGISVTYDDALDKFSFEVDDQFPSHDTDDLAEGAENKYFTELRAQTAVAQDIADAVSNAALGSTDDLTEGTTNLYFTEQRAKDAVAGDISTAVSNLVDAAPELLDTLNELAAAINDDENFAVTVAQNITDAIDALDTDAIEEGTTNKYFTDQRALDATTTSYDHAGSASTAEGNANTYTDTEIGNLTTDDIEEGVTNEYFTAQRAKDAAADLITNATLSNISITGSGSGLTISAENGVEDSTTSDLEEGTNLYFTNQRALDATAAAYDAAGTAAGLAGNYEAAGAVTAAIDALDTDAIEEGTTNLYFTELRAQTAVAQDIADAITDAALGSTDDLSEGTTNLYFTEERALDAVQTQLDSKQPTFTGYDYEIHVSQVDGNDTTGNGDLLTPVASVTKAIQIAAAAVGVSDRRTIIVHPGTYTENVAVSTGVYIIAPGALGANTAIAGTVTVTATARFTGIKMTNLVVNTTAPVYLYNSTVDTQMTVTNTGYLEITGCSLQCTSGVTISGAASAVVFNASSIWGLIVNNASTTVIVRNSPQVLVATVTAGTLAMSNSLVFPATNTGNAVTTSAGSVVTLSNLNILIPSGANVARVSLSGFYSIIDCVYDKPNSTLVASSGTGGTTNSIDYFQYINADKFITQGGTSSQFVKGDGSLDSVAYAPLASPTFTGTVTLPSGTVTSAMILDGTIANADISSSAAIDLSKLATDPLARANHTGSQTASTISDFNEAAQDAIGGILGTGLTYNDASNTITVDSTNIQLRVTGVTDTEIGYLDGVTSAIQTQIDAKAPLASPTFTGTVSAADLTISGNLTVNGTTTNLNSTNLVVEDKNIVLGDTATPTDITADGGGITLKGTTDKTFNWVDATDAWTSSEDINLLTGKVYEINGTTVLSSTQVLGKSLPSGTVVGTSDTQTLTNKTLTSPVINTPTGIVKADVGLGNVDNTTDAGKPVSTAQQTALDLKANLAGPTFTGTVVLPSSTSIGNVSATELGYVDGVTSAIQTQLDAKLASSTAASTYAPIAGPTFTGTVSGITKSMVGLGNVDNTADTAKPVSTAQQTALDLKANLAGPTFTGTVAAPTASTGDDSTKVATTAYVQGENIIQYVSLSGTTLTIASATHKFKTITCTSSSATTVSIPTDASDNWPIGTYVNVRQMGTGQVTIAAVTSGTTSVVATDSQLKTRVQYSEVVLEKTAANTWLVSGDTTA